MRLHVAVSLCDNRRCFWVLAKKPSRKRDANMKAQMHIAKQMGLDVYDVPQMPKGLSDHDFSDSTGNLASTPTCTELMRLIIANCRLRDSICLPPQVTPICRAPPDHSIPYEPFMPLSKLTISPTWAHT